MSAAAREARAANQRTTIVRTVEAAVESVTREVMERVASLDPGAWKQAPAARQSEVVGSVMGTVRGALLGGFRTMLEAEHAVATGTVDSVTFKDGVKGVVKLAKGRPAHELADREGNTVLMVMVDTGSYEETLSRLHEAYVDLQDQGELGLDDAAEAIARGAQEAAGDEATGTAEASGEPAPEGEDITQREDTALP